METRIVGNLHVPLSDSGEWLLKNGMVDGYPAYQYNHIEYALSLCKQKHTCIDGGGHIGSWTVHLAKHFQKVIAFEPIPENAECFRLNTAKMGNVILHQAILGDSIGTGHMYRHKEGRSFWRVGSEGLTVPRTTIDHLKLDNLDLLKLDVDGYEFEALQGALQTLEICRPVVLVEEKLDKRQRASKLLEQLGMKMVNQIKYDRFFVWNEVR